MKIVQSFWSKPSYKKKNASPHDRNNGGWNDKKYNYFSWTLSCLQFRKFYEQVELVTDEIGYDILINKLKLPYTKVDVSLDKLNDYHERLWALGKIYAFSIQDEPFLHADGDVFVFKKLDDSFDDSPVLVQNVEFGFQSYTDFYNDMKAQFTYIPEEMKHYYNTFNRIDGVNNGIVGGNDIPFFKRYTQKAFDFIDKNVDHLSKIDVGFFNIIYEQALLHSIVNKENTDIRYYLENVNRQFDGICDVLGSSKERSYLHALGVFKSEDIRAQQVEDLVRKEYPEYYNNIIDLLKTYQI